MNNQENCKYKGECANYEKACFKCFNYNFYQNHKEVSGLRSRDLSRKEKKQGSTFENKGIIKYNKTIKKSKEIAQKQIASGALHFALGDMITEEELTSAIAEFKQRGELSSSGQKQITIKKDWLDKLKKEANIMKKDYYFLPFSFKESDDIYVVLDYDILLSYIQTIQILLSKIKHDNYIEE
jgi:hypothetical protein